MIIWLNGTFGVGKTTTAKELTSRRWRLDHLPAHRAAALPWLRREATAIDTTAVPASRVAEIIIEHMSSTRPDSPSDIAGASREASDRIRR
ncbi:hypothetical protein ACFYY2_32625 [Streptomyces sp. NPDC001822]|uniref:hypothetical protein n=1 Tax=Streptomyces sp. NPDC001822 TaxID=3364614 RepID=UPI00369DE725